MKPKGSSLKRACGGCYIGERHKIENPVTSERLAHSLDFTRGRTDVTMPSDPLKTCLGIHAAAMLAKALLRSNME
jgi:hypothetical protein